MACLLTMCEAGSIRASGDTTPLIQIETCLNRITADSHSDSLLDEVNLRKSCPQLLTLLNHPRLAELEPPLEETTSFAQLHDVQRGLKSFEVTSEIPPSLDHAGLKQLLKEVYEPETKPVEIQNPIDKFWEWVGQKLREYFNEDNWFSRNFDFENNNATNVVDGLKNSIIVILIVLVVYIIINELHAAEITKLFRRRARRLHKRTADEPQSQRALLPGIKDISELPLNRQVTALLRYTLQNLIDKNVLPHRYNLTNQEFLAIVRHELPEAARDFELLVTSVDKVVYGRKSLAAGDTSILFDHVKKIVQFPVRVKA